jgi:hypothetical protein
MEAIVMQDLSQAAFSWISFFAIVGAVIFGVAAVFFWIQFFRTKRKRKRRHHGHDRIKPTLAEVGGLPPVRTDDPKHPAENPPFDP